MIKGDIGQCLECGNTFKAKKKDHKFCRKFCCNEWNRKKRGEEEPSFMRKKEQVINIEKGQKIEITIRIL